MISRKLRFSFFNPPVNSAQVRREIEGLDLSRQGAQQGQEAAGRGAPVTLVAPGVEINAICDVHLEKARQRSSGMLLAIQAKAERLTIGPAEHDFVAETDGGAGDFTRIDAEVRATLPRLAENVSTTDQGKRTFMASQDLVQEPSYAPSLLLFYGTTAASIAIEIGVTAKAYIGAVGETDAIVSAAMIGANVAAGALAAGLGTLYMTHRKDRRFTYGGSALVLVGGGYMTLGAFSAAHFRHVVAQQPEITAATAKAVLLSIWNTPFEPLIGDPVNLGLFSLSMAAGVILIAATYATWGYPGWRRHAIAHRRADGNMKRAKNSFARLARKTGKRWRNAIGQKTETLRRKAQQGTRLLEDIVAVVGAFNAASRVVEGERERGHAILRDRREQSLPPGMRGSGPNPTPMRQEPDLLTLPEGFAAPLKEMRNAAGNLESIEAPSRRVIDAREAQTLDYIETVAREARDAADRRQHWAPPAPGQLELV